MNIKILKMESNYEILEIKGYSGIYRRQKCGSFYYQGKLYGTKGGNPASIYLNSEYPHHIESIKRLSDGIVFNIGDRTSSGFISKINIRDGFVSFYHGPNSGPNLYLDEIEHVIEIPNKIKEFKNPCLEIYMGIGGDCVLEQDYIMRLFEPNKLLLIC